MLQIKQGARVGLLRPGIWAAANIAASIWEKFEIDCVITSGVEGTHSSGSLHYSGNAVDLRTRDFNSDGDVEIAAGLLREALQDDYDVVIESNHIHVELQPKLPL